MRSKPLHVTKQSVCDVVLWTRLQLNNMCVEGMMTVLVD